MVQIEPLKFRQGDLSDPLYFDFIAYSQYLAVNKEIKRGQQARACRSQPRPAPPQPSCTPCLPGCRGRRNG